MNNSTLSFFFFISLVWPIFLWLKKKQTFLVLFRIILISNPSTICGLEIEPICPHLFYLLRIWTRAAGVGPFCLALFVFLPSPTAEKRRNHIILPAQTECPSGKWWDRGGDEIKPGGLLLSQRSHLQYTGRQMKESQPRWLSVHWYWSRTGSLFRRLWGRGRDVLSRRLKGAVPRLTPHPPSLSLPLI